MSIRLVAVDVDLEEGVMLQLDYITYTDTLDCLVSFFSKPHTVAHVRYDLTTFPVLTCTIRSDGLSCPILYNINLGATHTTILSTRGVQIPIYLASSATDSF